MLTVKLENELLRGAVWVLGEDGITTEGELPLVEDDPVVLELNEAIAEMYSSYFEFDSHGQGCWFNEEQRKADREKMLSLLARLRARLEEINDGSFVVVDYETSYLLGYSGWFCHSPLATRASRNNGPHEYQMSTRAGETMETPTHGVDVARRRHTRTYPIHAQAHREGVNFGNIIPKFDTLCPSRHTGAMRRRWCHVHTARD